QLVRNSRYQQLAEGIERTDRRELERHQMGFAEWQLLQHGVRCLSVGHIQDEDESGSWPRSAPRLGLRFAVGAGHLCQIKFWLMQIRRSLFRTCSCLDVGSLARRKNGARFAILIDLRAMLACRWAVSQTWRMERPHSAA